MHTPTKGQSRCIVQWPPTGSSDLRMSRNEDQFILRIHKSQALEHVRRPEFEGEEAVRVEERATTIH